MTPELGDLAIVGGDRRTDKTDYFTLFTHVRGIIRFLASVFNWASYITPMGDPPCITTLPQYVLFVLPRVEWLITLINLQT